MDKFRKPHGNRDRDNRGGGRGNDRFDRPVQRFPATCSQCGKQCEVPFRPSNGKPVYCNTCFGSNKGSTPSYGGGSNSGGGFSSRSSESRPDSNYSRPAAADNRIDDIKRQLDSMNAKLESILQKIGGSKPLAPSVPAITLKTAPKTETKKKTAAPKTAKKKAGKKK